MRLFTRTVLSAVVISVLACSASVLSAAPRTSQPAVQAFLEPVAVSRSRLPAVLSASDAELYRQIFSLEQQGRWQDADALLTQLQDRILLGYVLAQRYFLSPAYPASEEELASWRSAYADLPIASDRASSGETDYSADSLNRAYASGWSGDSGSSTRAEGGDYDASAHLQSYFDPGPGSVDEGATVDIDSSAMSFPLMDGGRGSRAVDETWNAGIAAWRAGNYQTAAQHFESVAAESVSPWLRSGGAFWAARAYLHARQPELVNDWLVRAADYSKTFYGLLARRILGLPSPFQWEFSDRDRAALRALYSVPAGRRALALIQIDRFEDAERELKTLSTGSSADVSHGIMIVADYTGMAQLAFSLHRSLRSYGIEFDGAAYPVPRWTPHGGFVADRALVYALIRQESNFNPRAVSPVGARGVMQLMPATARFVAQKTYVPGGDPTRLATPEINMALGQKYIEMLLGDHNVGTDLFRLAVAWNGGPGNLGKWDRQTGYVDDPLLFIETIPARETRIFIERVLANLWTYRDRLGQPMASLDSLAAGAWPGYDGFGIGSPVEIAEQHEQR